MSNPNFAHKPEDLLSTCESEPIHIPGRVQVHGVLLVIEKESWRILQCSDNVKLILERDVNEVLNLKLGELLDSRSFLALDGLVFSHSFNEVNPINLRIADLHDKEFEGVFIDNDDCLLLEMTPIQPDARAESARLERQLQATLDAIDTATNRLEACHIAAYHVRKLTGFDRVMVYQFDADWHGEVIAEDKSPQVESEYLGLHFPSSDIPAIARKLYELSPVRTITDILSTESAMVPTLHPITQKPADMSRCNLRGVSPVHVEYLSNMGVRATASVSIVVQGRLWGLVACHNYSPKLISFNTRRCCAVVSRYLSRVVEALELSERLNAKTTLKKRVRAIFDGHSDHALFASMLLSIAPQLVELFGASGFAYLNSEEHQTYGVVPPPEALNLLRGWLKERVHLGARGYESSRLVERFPEIAPWGDVAAGIIAIQISRPSQSYVVFFRPEYLQSVSWAGEPVKDVKNTGEEVRLSPRKSFEAWTQTVRGRSRPWTSEEVDALLALRGELVELELRRELRRARLFEQVLKSTSEGVLITDADPDSQRVLFANSAIASISGYSESEILGFNPRFLQGPETDPETIAAMRDAIRHRTPFHAAVLNYRKDGSTFWDDLSISPVYDVDQELIAFIGIQRDISEARAQQQKIREAETRLQSHIQTTPLAVIHFDPQGAVLEWSPAAERIFGWSAAEVVGRSLGGGPDQVDMLSAVDAERVWNTYQSAVTSGAQSWIIENHNRRKDGQTIVCRWHNSILRDSEGKLTSVLSIAEDISERLANQRALEESLSKYEAVFNSTNQGIAITDSLGVIESVNEAMLKMFEYPDAESMIGLNVSALVPATHRSRHDGYLREFHNGAHSRIVGVGRDVAGVTAKGDERPYSVVVQRLTLDASAKFVALVRDLSHQRAMEQQLQRSQRLEAVGTLAGGIAHDFNNILSPIFAQADLGIREKSLSDSARSRFTKIKAAAERARAVVGNLLKLAKSEGESLQVIDLADVVHEVFELMREATPKNIEVKCHIEADLPRVFGNPTLLHQVLVNLVTNAVQAMANRVGVVSMSLRQAAGTIAEGGQAALHNDVETLVLEVSDNGPGVPDDLKERIFNPFFTTKGAAGGSGLGLAMTHQIIEEHMGSIRLTDTPGGGATFRILLPVLSHIGDGDSDQSDLPIESGETQRALKVLVVDDEHSTGMALVEMLQEFDAKATFRSSPLGVSEELKDGRIELPDLVILDHAMPQMVGTELAARLLAEYPDLAVIILSGDIAAVKQGDELSSVRLMQKPIDLNAVEKLLREYGR